MPVKPALVRVAGVLVIAVLLVQQLSALPYFSKTSHCETEVPSGTRIEQDDEYMNLAYPDGVIVSKPICTSVMSDVNMMPTRRLLQMQWRQGNVSDGNSTADSPDSAEFFAMLQAVRFTYLPALHPC
jgi:hypothetical protein